MVRYEAQYTIPFGECVKKHRGKKKRIKSLVSRILADPRSPNSHLLTKVRNIDLRGKRSRHLGNFVVVYIVCEECIQSDFRRLGYNKCKDCRRDPKQVIFLAVGPHDDIYRKEWQARF
jgi:mRNA-degrading endonuclease RelE of RelBE toxin-antitoxin system